MAASLSSEYSSFLNGFHRLTQEIGLSETEKDAELASVRQQIQAFFTNKQHELEVRKETMIKGLDESKERTTKIAMQLGDIHPPPEPDSSRSLKDQYEAAMARVTSLVDVCSNTLACV